MTPSLDKPRLRAIIDALGEGLLERDTAIRLALLAALAGEHLLLIGPPGSAKSELARRLHRAFSGGSYFERLLTRFTVPEELFGPLSIAALEEDRFERRTDGYLPSASIAFVDEVFKANSAILNALLTLLNEREFDNGARRQKTPLICVVGASNEVPTEDLLAAFYDRFLLRCQVQAVSDAAFADLLQQPDLPPQDLPADLRISAEEVAALHRQRDAVTLPAEVIDALHDLRALLADKGIAVSDRRWRRLVGLLRTAALTDGRHVVSVWDLWLTQFCACEHPQQAGLIEEWFGRRLGTHEALNPERLERVVTAFEVTLENEQNAQDLAFDEGGKLAVARSVGGSTAGDVAPRLSSFMAQRRYGENHINARLGQLDELLANMDAYLASLDALITSFADQVAQHLWIAPAYAGRGRTALESTREAVCVLRARAGAVRNGFACLPRLEGPSGPAPAPVEVESRA